MNNHNLENFMKLAAVGNKRDAYYEKAYQTIYSGKKMNWNWSAALLGSTWMIYRKMYLYSALSYIGLIVFLIASITPLFIFTDVKNITTIGFAVRAIILIGCLITPFIIQGLFSNWLYVKHIHKKIDNNYHVCTLKNTDRPTIYFFYIANIITSIINEVIQTKTDLSSRAILNLFLLLIAIGVPMISIIITVISDKRKVTKAVAEQQKTIPQI